MRNRGNTSPLTNSTSSLVEVRLVQPLFMQRADFWGDTVPCLRRATSLAYTDADEGAEELLSFGGDGGDMGDEWVQTHAGRRASLDSVRIKKLTIW